MFSSASAVRPGPDGGFLVAITPDWFQGPGAHGGLTSALLLRAMASEIRWAPRSFSVQFCAPVPAGTSRIEVQIVRKGAATAFVQAQLLHADRVCAHAIASFGADRSPDLDADELEAPDLPPEHDLPRTELRGGPAFLQHWDLRVAHGSLPFSGAREARVAAWIRPVVPEVVDPFLALALLDVMPPAILPKATSPRPMATVSLSCHFLAPLPDPSLDPSRSLLVDTRSRLTHGGFSDQEGHLFTPSFAGSRGRVVAIARQLVAVVR